MAYEKKTWVDRQVEYPGRRKLMPSGTADVFDVTREEGLEVEAGDLFNAATMNDLEERVGGAIDTLAANAVPSSRTVNNKPLSGNISLAAADVGAAAASHTHLAQNITSGVFSGGIGANAAATAVLGTAQIREIYAGTGDMAPGSTALQTGRIYIVYE